MNYALRSGPLNFTPAAAAKLSRQPPPLLRQKEQQAGHHRSLEAAQKLGYTSVEKKGAGQ
ncbi:MAG: hypothetical protein HFF69_06485 [Oscillospiraceae bacterium]|jgi:hypothetical protein|nr:hypothetical protein [Oscillospiraceae bacterium]